MYRIEILPHTADVRFRLTADSLEEVFHAGIESLADFLYEGVCGDAKHFDITHEIDISSIDTTTLLVDFLSDVLTQSYHDKAIFCRTDILTLSKNQLRAKIFGKKVSEFQDDIKAVTYHEAEVQKNEDGKWQTYLIIDI
jgi:SHS2 domain-containing protein